MRTKQQGRKKTEMRKTHTRQQQNKNERNGKIMREIMFPQTKNRCVCVQFALMVLIGTQKVNIHPGKLCISLDGIYGIRVIKRMKSSQHTHTHSRSQRVHALQ